MQLFNRGMQTQNQGPFAREPLYKLAEVAEILDTTSQKLGVLIARHKIEPALKSRGIGRWRVSDFKKAFNAEFGVEKFKVEKAVPITPIQTSQTETSAALTTSPPRPWWLNKNVLTGVEP